MAPRSRSTARASSTSRRPKEAARTWALPVVSRAELTAGFAQALDLAEGREPGHAARVCYVALNLARSLDLPDEEQRAVFYGALLHDAGAAPAAAEPCRLLGLTEEALFGGRLGKSPQRLALEIAPTRSAQVVEVLRNHVARGVEVAGQLGSGTDVQEAIASHHERWDGKGYPHAIKGEAISAAGRIVAAADHMESWISAEGNALAARRNLVASLAEEAGAALDPKLAELATALVRSDSFWLGLHNERLTRELASACPDDLEMESPSDLRTFATVFAGLADAKGEHTSEHSARTADIAGQLGEALGFTDEHRELLWLAGLLHDVGLLGVPARIIAKPDILSLTEMEAMRGHPTYSQMVLEGLPGLEDVARWVGAHHERPDGKGYPEMLADTAIPLEGRILALADTYVAVTSVRPYRKALAPEDAQQVLLGGAGTQLDRELVLRLCALPIEPTSSRTARRSRRKR